MPHLITKGLKKSDSNKDKKDVLIAEPKKIIDNLKAFNQRAITTKGLVLDTAKLENAYQGVNPDGSSGVLFGCLREITDASFRLLEQDPVVGPGFGTRSDMVEDKLKIVLAGAVMIISGALLATGLVSLPLFALIAYVVGSLLIVDSCFLKLDLPDFIMCPSLYGEMPSMHGELDYAALKSLTLFNEAPPIYNGGDGDDMIGVVCAG